jgi:transposase-like protein
MQVLLSEGDWKRYRAVARGHGMTLAEWVRQSLRKASLGVSTADAELKLKVVRQAARHRFPAPDIDQMLAEIEAGYGQRE